MLENDKYLLAISNIKHLTPPPFLLSEQVCYTASEKRYFETAENFDGFYGFTTQNSVKYLALVWIWSVEISTGDCH